MGGGEVVAVVLGIFLSYICVKLMWIIGRIVPEAFLVWKCLMGAVSTFDPQRIFACLKMTSC